MSRQIRTFLRRLLGKSKNREINPDEIFLDSSNLPEFDRDQFEGRLEHPIPKKTQSLVLFVFGGLLVLFLIQIADLEVRQGAAFASLSEGNRLRNSIIFAERGVLYDRNGLELVWNEAGEDAHALRVYRQMDGLGQVLGYVGYPLKDTSGVYYQKEYRGKGGAELLFNDRLEGSNGIKIQEVDALQEVTSESITRPAEDGENITLSVDARLNQALYRLIRDRAGESGFVGGAGVVIDVESGEVVILASYPEYAPQVLTDGEPHDLIDAYVRDPRKPFLNRVVSGLYTPGSIAKLIVASGALMEGVITPEKKILSTGSIRVPHPYLEDVYSTFVDWKAHGWVDMREAIAYSSNVYFYEVGGGFEDQPGIGIDAINTYAHLFGFGKSTGVFFGEAGGVIPNPEWKAETFNGDEWRIGDTYNTAIGQYGFQVTPIQVARAVAAIANNGKLLTPSLEKGAPVKFETIPIDEEYLQVVREGMHLGAEEGSARALNTPYVSIAAKTGTAQLGVRKEFVNSWVAGFFPYEKPRYAFAIIMERGPVSNLVGASAVMRSFIEWLHREAPEYLESVN
ncbi:MAG: penicillin-binding transpeptidase domain-containing protein [Candidatus Pacebacteria bacterium]|nr:penicillin-binding transpeptidase domain-containing protein [Candidatus Paceibacterota bacterium]